MGQQRTNCSSRTLHNNVVRAFDLSAERLDAGDVYRAESTNESVLDVAYSAESDTLFVATRNNSHPNDYVVRSFVRTNNSWIPCHRMAFASKYNGRGMLRVLRDTILFFWRAELFRPLLKFTGAVCTQTARFRTALYSNCPTQLGILTCSSPPTEFGWPPLCETGRWRSFVWTQSTTCCSRYRTPLFPTPDTYCSAETLCWWQRESESIGEAVSFSIREDRLQRERPLTFLTPIRYILSWWFFNERLFLLDDWTERMDVYRVNYE